MVGDLQPPLPGMEWVVGHPPVPRSCVEVRVGQVWLFANRRDELFEIIGFSANDKVCVIKWLPGAGPGLGSVGMRIGGTVHIDEANFCLGAGGGESMGLDIFLHHSAEERHRRTGATVCTIIATRDRHPAAWRPRVVPPMGQAVRDVVGDLADIYGWLEGVV